MRDIPLGTSNESNQLIAKTIERCGWGVLFIWLGLTLLMTLGWGISLLGLGIILLACQAARVRFELHAELLGLVLGVCLITAGLTQLLDLQWNKAQINVWLIPTLFIIAGVATLVAAWHRRPRQ